MVDANVLISAALGRASAPAMVLKVCESNSSAVTVSGETVEEFRRALSRKAKWPAGEVAEAVASLREVADVVEPTLQMTWPGLKDIDDGHLFDAALYAGADIMVSGDRIVRNYIPPNFEIKILTPREFVERYA
jgi:putative PIN family toxin of toxin-antitoxin system